MFYRKKPVVIEAMRFGDNLEEIERFVGNNGRVVLDDSGTWFAIDTLEGVMRANPGDWIIKGVKGEFYPCKPDIFEATYEAVDAVRDKDPVCVKCGAKLIVTSTCEFEPSISHAQCCGLSYTIGEPSTDTAADQECDCDNCNLCVEQLREEVRRLREENERLKEELSALTNPSDARCMEIGMLREQREKLQAQVERLEAALKNMRSDAVDAAGIKE